MIVPLCIRLAALAATTLAAGGLAAGLLAPPAAALPGQCVSSPWGGFCDSDPWPDGSFWHTETYGVGGFSASNSFQACHDPATNRAVPTDNDPTTPC